MPGPSLVSHEVPIVGRPVLVQAYAIVVTATCQCQVPGVSFQLLFQQTALGLQATPGVCPACRTVYAIPSLQMANGQLLFDFHRSPPAGSLLAS